MDVPDQPAEASPRGRTRRWVLATVAAVVAGGGAGVGVEAVRHRNPRPPRAPRPPGVLVAAVAAEQRLIADLDATTGGAPAVRELLAQVRADHAEHLRVLRAVVATRAAVMSGVSTGGVAAPSASASGLGSGSVAATGTPRTRAELRSAEASAAAAAARRAALLTGDTAALLASISACEATHAELLA